MTTKIKIEKQQTTITTSTTAKTTNYKSNKYKTTITAKNY